MILIESFNLYARQYPDRRVISRRQLHLLKLIRAEGLDVQITGNRSHELNFLSTKGIREWISDPLILTIVGVPISIVCGVLSNALYGLFSSRKPPADVVLELDENGTRTHYRSDGSPIERHEFDALLGAMQERRRRHSSGRPHLNGERLQSPYPDKRIPLFLEHTDRVVGRGTVVNPLAQLKSPSHQAR